MRDFHRLLLLGPPTQLLRWSTAGVNTIYTDGRNVRTFGFRQWFSQNLDRDFRWNHKAPWMLSAATTSSRDIGKLERNGRRNDVAGSAMLGETFPELLSLITHSESSVRRADPKARSPTHYR
ncbi:hypothetical protein HETIRDRAFT_429963 [Heterobasidion irregulare TC 32-1]|uniref:Uncharacterized protein n=1 Tax=Heterobasidion irregulare (strain TC 32-1) TaxID=747525 RepID=W4JSW8_HETIT|nr:uncharacterized protein HETIRDRAFT_429963 [Heterobasidion irregulare TC 32-1]ETW76554.1 hypothetical protein HETIRDRAFT_429963 [Heterobasidion irregulare TC 32-1]